MLLTADWVVPVSSEPIRDGAVLIHGSRILAVGTAAELGASFEGQRRDLPGCTIMPGLVNAHTHLALTCLRGVIPSMPFHDWITRIPRAFNALSPDDVVVSIALGAAHSMACGVTAIGDIAYGADSIAIAADTGLGGVFFWEVLGITPEQLPKTLGDAEYPTDPQAECRGRLRCGVSPHSVYTSGPELIKASHAMTRKQHAPFAIHVAESPAEEELVRSGEGPLADVARRLAAGFASIGDSEMAYLDGLGVLDGAIAVHCVNVTPDDAALMAGKVAGAVLCPRSNAYLHNGVPPVWTLEQAGVPLALGTDSSASNTDLDLFAEARALAAIEPRLSPSRLIEMMTIDAARILGIGADFGSLEPGRQADMAIYAVNGDDPLEALVAGAGRSTVESVMSAGVWRMLGGSPTFGVSPIERAAHLAGQRAALALALADDGF